MTKVPVITSALTVAAAAAVGCAYATRDGRPLTVDPGEVYKREYAMIMLNHYELMRQVSPEQWKSVLGSSFGTQREVIEEAEAVTKATVHAVSLISDMGSDARREWRACMAQPDVDAVAAGAPMFENSWAYYAQQIDPTVMSGRR